MSEFKAQVSVMNLVVVVLSCRDHYNDLTILFCPIKSNGKKASSPPPGMLRFNTDIGRLEVWRNDHWATILGESPNLGDQNNSNSTGGTGTRAVFGGGYAPGGTDHMDYITIDTLGNAQDFGDLGVTLVLLVMQVEFWIPVRISP